MKTNIVTKLAISALGVAGVVGFAGCASGGQQVQSRSRGTAVVSPTASPTPGSVDVANQAGAAGPVNHGTQVQPAPATSTPPESAGKPLTTAAQAVALSRSDSTEFPDVTRAEAKQTTWGTLRTSSDLFADGQPATALQVAASEPVWVVAVSGHVVPEFSKGTSYNSGVIVYDAKTQAVLGMAAHHAGGDWPQWFDALPTGR